MSRYDSKQEREDKRGDCCPTCRRVFREVNDYPRVRVLTFERLPIPEAVDEMSGFAAERGLARRSSEPDGGELRRDGGINMTPAIAEACNRADVRAYFEQVAHLVNQEIEPSTLRPPWPEYRMFRWARRLGDTGLCLAFRGGRADA